MSNPNFKKIAQRIVGQVKFKPTLSSWDDTLKTSKEFEGDYENWKIEDTKGVVLFSSDEKKLLQVLYNNIVYINEKNDDVAEMITHVQKSFSDVSGGDIEIAHLGFRNIQIFGVKFEFDELADMLYKKIYKESIVGISCDKVEDVLFSLRAEKDGIRNNVMVGPVTKEEAILRFSSQFEDSIDSSDKAYKSFIYVDIDTYAKKGPDISDLTELINKNKEIVSNFLNYIK